MEFLTFPEKKNIIDLFHKAKNRLILLDYDGTLVPFKLHPSHAKPDQELRELFKKLAAISNTTVFIISGREKYFLQTELGFLNIGLVAEHGAWIRDFGQNWKKLIDWDAIQWKKNIIPILSDAISKIPGIYYEEKDTALVFHFRQISAINEDSVQSFYETLLSKIDKKKYTILQGDQILEIRLKNIHKGLVCNYLLSKSSFDYILSIGDDNTDEDMFFLLPEGSINIKVGKKESHAKFCLPDPQAVRQLLFEFHN